MDKFVITGGVPLLLVRSLARLGVPPARIALATCSALPDLDDLELAEIKESLESGWVTTGPKTKQFEADFLKLNPNAKVPVIVDSDGPGGKPYTCFESGAILLYLAEKTGKFLPANTPPDEPKGLAMPAAPGIDAEAAGMQEVITKSASNRQFDICYQQKADIPRL